MKFTSLFFENFFGILSAPFQSLGTTGSSAVMGGTSTFLTAADCLTDGIKQFTTEDGNTLAGSLCSASATATVVTYLQVNDVNYPDIQVTKAYVESLSEEELNELIANLDGIKFDIPEEENILSKRI